MGRIAQSRLSLSAELRKQRSTLTNKGTLFEGTGIHFPSPGVVEVDGQLQGAGFDGDLATDNVGTTGWALSATKAAMPELLLRPGSIGNDALTNPVKPAIVRLSQAPFSLSTSYATLDSASVTVPDGFTKLFVPNATARLYVVNTNTTGGGDGAGLEAIYVKVSVGANESTATPTGVSGFNGFATTFANDAFLLEDLTPGSSVSFTLQGKCAYSGVPSYADNYAIASFGLSWSR
jgi:hypothetical protein